MKKVKAISILLVLLLIVTGCGCSKKEKKILNPKKEEIKEVSFPTQEIDGLKISKFKIVYKDGISNIEAKAYNTLDNSINIVSIEILLYDNNSELITSTLGYIGGEISSKSEIPITASVTIDLRKAKSVKYNIIKNE